MQKLKWSKAAAYDGLPTHKITYAHLIFLCYCLLFQMHGIVPSAFGQIILVPLVNKKLSYRCQTARSIETRVRGHSRA